jgi:hypothetical protein
MMEEPTCAHSLNGNKDMQEEDSDEELDDLYIEMFGNHKRKEARMG